MERDCTVSLSTRALFHTTRIQRHRLLCFSTRDHGLHMRVAAKMSSYSTMPSTISHPSLAQTLDSLHSTFFLHFSSVQSNFDFCCVECAQKIRRFFRDSFSCKSKAFCCRNKAVSCCNCCRSAFTKPNWAGTSCTRTAATCSEMGSYTENVFCYMRDTCNISKFY